VAEAPSRADGGIGRIIRDIATAMLRSGEAAEALGRATAGATAQRDAGGGLGIQNIRRMVAFAESAATGNMTVANATSGFASLSTPLRLQTFLSGRPVMVLVTGKVSPGTASASISFDVKMRGVSVTGLSTGLPGCYVYGSTNPLGVMGFWPVMTPEAGEANFEVTADAVTADGTIYVGAGADALALMVIEL